MNPPHTFHCKFAGGVSVTVIFDEEEFQKTKDVFTTLDVKWSGTPTKKTIQRYVTRMHGVMQSIAQIIDDKICYAYPPSDVWVYFPDGSRKKVDRRERF